MLLRSLTGLLAVTGRLQEETLRLEEMLAWYS